jgi:hypothetical protein
MSGSERLDPKTGPLGNLSQAYFGNLDLMVKGYEPTLKGVGRWNLELVGLMARRAQAWLEIPSRLSHCQTPADVFGEHVRFWQAAAADYAEGSHRLAAAWGACAMLPKANGAEPRDYITFAEPQEQPAAAAKRGDRKAA